MRKIILSIAIVFMLSHSAFAQTVIVVPFTRSDIAWDAPAFTELNAPERYVLTCTSTSLAAPVTHTVLHPTTVVPLSSVIPGTGVYTCTVRAENVAGASPESDALSFAAVGPPTIPGNVRIEGK